MQTPQVTNSWITNTTILIRHYLKELQSIGIYPVTLHKGTAGELVAAGNYGISVVKPDRDIVGLIGPGDFDRPMSFIRLFKFPANLIDRMLIPNERATFFGEVDIALLVEYFRPLREYSPATFADLAALGAQYPDLQKEGDIAGLDRGFKWNEKDPAELAKYPLLRTIRYEDGAIVRVFDWMLHLRREELSRIRFAVKVK